jgi:hypothetical protein
VAIFGINMFGDAMRESYSTRGSGVGERQDGRADGRLVSLTVCSCDHRVSVGTQNIKTRKGSDVALTLMDHK